MIINYTGTNQCFDIDITNYHDYYKYQDLFDTQYEYQNNYQNVFYTDNYNYDFYKKEYNKPNIDSIQIISDILLIYYFFSIILSRNIINTKISENIINMMTKLDTPSETLTNREKSEDLIGLTKFISKIVYVTIYVCTGYTIKIFLINELNNSFINIYSNLNNQIVPITPIDQSNVILIKVFVYTIVSNIFDKSLFSNGVVTKFLRICKNIGIGLVLFTSQTDSDYLIKNIFYSILKFEFLSLLAILFLF